MTITQMYAVLISLRPLDLRPDDRGSRAALSLVKFCRDRFMMMMAVVAVIVVTMVLVVVVVLDDDGDNE